MKGQIISLQLGTQSNFVFSEVWKLRRKIYSENDSESVHFDLDSENNLNPRCLCVDFVSEFKEIDSLQIDEVHQFKDWDGPGNLVIQDQNNTKR